MMVIFLFVTVVIIVTIYNVFGNTGSKECVHVNEHEPEIKELDIDGHKLQLSSNVFLRPSTYTLGITGEYARILENPVIWLALMK
jgi:hypothetical protein